MLVRARTALLAPLLVAGATLIPAGAAVGADAGENADFNGDGYADLAISATNLGVEGAYHAGGVYVLLGDSGGVSGVGSQLVTRATPGVPRAPHDFEQFGGALAWGDFDGDGFDDLAVGAEDCCTGDEQGAGSVTVVPGSAAGLTGADSTVWSERTDGVPGKARLGDRFGTSVAAADFDADGYDDLAIGVLADEIAHVSTGTVRVIYGSASGIGGDRDVDRLRLSNPRAEDELGTAMAAGDFDGDGHVDLAVGAPGRDVDDVEDTGLVAVFSSSVNGLDRRPYQKWSAGSPHVEGPLESEGLGVVLAAGELTADGRDDLAVTATWESATGHETELVRVLFSSADGLTGKGSQLWTEFDSGIPVGPRDADGFGDALLVADVTGDGQAELSLSHTADYIESLETYGGSVFILPGTPTGPVVEGVERWNQASAGIAEVPRDLEYFGSALVASDVDRDDQLDVIVGVPMDLVEEGEGWEHAAGMVQILFRSADGTTFTHDQRVTLESEGVEGDPGYGDFFGSALAG